MGVSAEKDGVGRVSALSVSWMCAVWVLIIWESSRIRGVGGGG